MSNCYSSQAEYDDHDFKDGICADCGQVDRPSVRELGVKLAETEAKVAELTERNRRLANQIVGYQSRVNDSLSAVIKNPKASALRSFADEVRDFSGDHIARHVEGMARARADKLDTL